MRSVPLDQPLRQMRRDALEVVLDGLVDIVIAAVAGHEQMLEILGEGVADDPQRQIGLRVQLMRRRVLLRLLLDRLPLRLQAVDVGGQFFLAGALGGSADDDRRLLGDHRVEDLLQTMSLRIRQLAADPRQVTAGRVDEIASRKRDVAGQPGALGADRVLADLDEHRLARLEDLLDLAPVGADIEGIPVDLTGIQHGVAAAADVDEHGLHAGQHVLHAAQVDIADQRGGGAAVDVVLDEHVVLQHRELGVIVALANHHDPLHRFAAGEELGLGQDRRTVASGSASFTAALLLGLQPGRPLDPGDLIAAGVLRLANPHDHVAVLRRVIAAATATTTPAGGRSGRLAGFLLLAGLVLVGLVAGLVVTFDGGCLGLGVVLGVLVALIAGARRRPATAATAAATATTLGRTARFPLLLVGGLSFVRGRLAVVG